MWQNKYKFISRKQNLKISIIFFITQLIFTFDFHFYSEH